MKEKARGRVDQGCCKPRHHGPNCCPNTELLIKNVRSDFKAVIIPSSWGNSSTGDYVPKVGAYTNTIVVYKGDNSTWLYDDKGYYAQITSGDTIVVDSTLDCDSANPLENQVICELITEIKDSISELQTELDELSERIDKIETQIEAILEDIAELQDRMDDAESRLDAIESDLEAIHELLDEMEEDIAQNAADIATNAAAIAVLESRMDSAEERILALEERMDDAEDRLDAIESDVDDLQECCAANTASIENLDSEVAEIFADLAELDDRMTTAEDDIDDLEELTAELSTSLSVLQSVVEALQEYYNSLFNGVFNSVLVIKTPSATLATYAPTETAKKTTASIPAATTSVYGVVKVDSSLSSSSSNPVQNKAIKNALSNLETEINLAIRKLEAEIDAIDIGNGSLYLKSGGTTLATFTANQSGSTIFDFIKVSSTDIGEGSSLTSGMLYGVY